MITLYKRNSQGKPIFWTIEPGFTGINVSYGIVGKSAHGEHLTTLRDINAEITSLVKTKRKEGYKELKDLYDNDKDVHKLLDIAMSLEGMPRQTSTHACRNHHSKRVG